MTEHYSYKDAVITHRESSKKFDYFLLGITLAFLAFSIERFTSLSGYINKWLIIASWIFLLISFLSGLYRQEGIVAILQSEVDKFRWEPRYKQFKEISEGVHQILDETGKPWSKEDIQKEFKELEKAMDIIKNRMDTHANRAINAYNIQKVTFVLGLIFTAAFKIMNTWDGVASLIVRLLIFQNP